MGPEVMFMGLVIVVIFFIALYAITLSSIDERTRESEIHAEHVSKQLEEIHKSLASIEKRLNEQSPEDALKSLQELFDWILVPGEERDEQIDLIIKDKIGMVRLIEFFGDPDNDTDDYDHDRGHEKFFPHRYEEKE